MKIGEIMASDREITLNEGKKAVTIMVANKGDRPVQVGSHFHFFEVNRASPLTGKKHTAITSISLPELRSVLSRARKKRFSSPRWAAECVSSVSMTCAQAADDTKAASLENAKLKGFL